MNFFRKKQTVDIEQPKADPTEISPENAEDYVKRGYAYYARGEHSKADDDFHKALSMNSGSAEIYYALGLNLKMMERTDDAVDAFGKALKYMPSLEKENPIRAHMLSRIAKGHINQMTKGHWNLRKEFWEAESES